MSVSSLLWYPSLGSLPLSWLLRVHGGHPQTSLYPGGSVLEQVMPDALLSPHCGTAGLSDVTSPSGCPKVTAWLIFHRSTSVLFMFKGRSCPKSPPLQTLGGVHSGDVVGILSDGQPGLGWSDFSFPRPTGCQSLECATFLPSRHKAVRILHLHLKCPGAGPLLLWCTVCQFSDWASLPREVFPHLVEDVVFVTSGFHSSIPWKILSISCLLLTPNYWLWYQWLLIHLN